MWEKDTSIHISGFKYKLIQSKQLQNGKQNTIQLGKYY